MHLHTFISNEIIILSPGSILLMKIKSNDSKWEQIVWHIDVAFWRVECLRAYVRAGVYVCIYNPKINIGWRPVKAIIQCKYTYGKTNTHTHLLHTSQSQSESIITCKSIDKRLRKTNSSSRKKQTPTQQQQQHCIMFEHNSGL